MTFGTFVTIAIIIFSAGMNYALIRSQIKENSNSITGLKAYMERHLTEFSLRLDELQNMVKKHQELFELMGFNTPDDVKTFMKRRREDSQFCIDAA